MKEKKKKSKCRKIQINKVKYIFVNTFTGEYAYDINNLPHEAINFIKSDDNKFYAFIPPYGLFTKDYWKIINECEDKIVFVYFKTTDHSGILEILGYSRGVKYFFANKIKVKKGSNGNIEVRKQIKQKENEDKEYKKRRDNIVFGGVPIRKIYDRDQTTNQMYVSIQFDNTYVPKNTILISAKKSKLDHVYKINTKLKINNNSMRAYFMSNQKATKDIDKIINNKKLWEKPNKLQVADKDATTNYLKAALQQNNEVIFTNLLYYFLSSNTDLLKKFVKNFLKFDKRKVDFSNENVTIYREKNKMDLSIEIDKSKIIIIENKIKSYINGIKKKKKNKKIESQLSKNFNIVKDRNMKVIGAFLLHPDYVNIDLKKFVNGNKYKHLKYSKLYAFLKRNIKLIDNKNNKEYYIDFLKTMKKHTEKVDNEFRNDIMERLKRRVLKSKKKGKGA